MYRTVQDFLDAWKHERVATLENFKLLTDASLQQKITPDGRSLGFLAWHIIINMGTMGNQSGLQIPAPPRNTPIPNRAGEIVSAYDTASSAIAAEVEKKWTDTMLTNEIQLFGRTWKLGGVLASLVTHQAHHRGQMTVLMRQAGIPVHGVYGPAKEEWAQRGMQAPM